MLGCAGWVCVLFLYVLEATVTEAERQRGMSDRALYMTAGMLVLAAAVVVAGLLPCVRAAGVPGPRRPADTIGITLNFGLVALIAGWCVLRM